MTTPARSPLDLDQPTMRRLGHLVTDVVAEHLATLRDQPAFVTMSRREAESLIAGPPPEQGADFEALLATLRERVFPNAAREPHPGFMAYVPGCPTFPAILGDWLATGYNFFAGVWPVAAGPNELELVVLDWFRRWIGMPEGAGGLLTSGGSSSMLMAMIAAREAVVGEDAERLPRLAVYTSQQAHSAMLRAAWVAGVPRTQVRAIPVDDDYRMRVDLLEEAIRKDRAAGLIPLAVGATAGTTNTGAVDPMHAIADLCAREKVWMHVDAAYGGFAMLTDRGAQALDGLGRADSVTIDAHKWLFVPFECGCLLARDPRRLKAAFQVYPDYLKDVEATGEQVNFADYGEQLTRYARALKVWLSVSYFGLGAIRDAIDHAMDLAVLVAERVREEPMLELLTPAQLGVVCFRLHPPGMEDPATLDALNERVNAAVNRQGPYFISSTRLMGVVSLRVCILGFRTAREDVEGLLQTIVALARE